MGLGLKSQRLALAATLLGALLPGALNARAESTSALIVDSDIEIPGAVHCLRALDLAIHAGTDPRDLSDLYPEGWAVVPVKTATGYGAHFFHEKRPDWSSYHSEDTLVPTPHGYFMDYWGDERALIEASRQGKEVYDKKVRGRLAQFLAERMSKIFLKLTKPGPAQTSAQASSAHDALERTFASPDSAVHDADLRTISTKISLNGKKKLGKGDRAVVDRVEAWTKKEMEWNRKSVEWFKGGRIGDPPPNPEGEPSSADRERYAVLLDRIEEAGIKSLSASEKARWKELNTSLARGESPSATYPLDPAQARRDELNRKNQELLDAVDAHFAAWDKLSTEEEMKVTRESLISALKTCEKIRGEDRLIRLAAEYLLALERAPNRTEPKSKSSKASEAR